MLQGIIEEGEKEKSMLHCMPVTIGPSSSAPSPIDKYEKPANQNVRQEWYLYDQEEQERHLSILSMVISFIIQGEDKLNAHFPRYLCSYCRSE